MRETGLWYVAMNGQQQGPMTTQQVLQLISAGQIDWSAYAFGPGMADWTPITTVSTFADVLLPARLPPPPPAGSAPAADEIDFEIFGDQSQFVEITLDPGEACVADAGALMYMDPGIEAATVLGDGTLAGPPSEFMRQLLSTSRPIGGEGVPLAFSVFANGGDGRRRVAFAAPGPGTIVPLDLRERGGNLLCQKDAFLCAAKGIAMEIVLRKEPQPGVFGAEGYLLELLEGNGLAFLHAGGTVVPRDLADGETVRVEASCLVALEPRVTWEIQSVPGVRSALFGPHGLLLATLAGPGRVWLQSLPPTRVAGRAVAASASPVSDLPPDAF